MQMCRQEIQAARPSRSPRRRGKNADTTIRSLRDVLTKLKAVDAPKTLMFVSQGFFMRTPTRRPDRESIGLGALAAAARTSIYAFRLEENPNDVTRPEGPVNPALSADDRRERRPDSRR